MPGEKDLKALGWTAFQMKTVGLCYKLYEYRRSDKKDKELW